MKLEGVYTALVTPMASDGSLDEKALRRLVDFQIEGGVQGLVPVGTTGESPTLDGDECKRVIQIVVEQSRGRVPVIAGAGSNATAEAIEYTRDAKEVGAVATLQVAPYYNKPTSDGFLRHFRAIADAVDLPLVVYNIAGRTGKNIDNPTMLELARHRNIVAVKEASGDIPQVMELILRKPGAFSVLSGDDNLVLPIMALGGTGVISVASNLVPDRMARFVNAMLKEDWAAARSMHYELLPLFKALFVETNPIPIKAAMAMKGLIVESYRLPMCPLAPKSRETLAAALKDLRIL
ncbi:MAG TPA: 4-hydroxy-tetrahydrodipicolinate synthase [Spirochaetia bacterium]|nr:4-hydroxy-tetrahydrodipicolinate synthase [Spirochaetia bacterium]